MITIALTNRDRNLRIVKKCLDSLRNQSLKEFEVFLVDYGSDLHYIEELKDLVKEYPFLKLIACPVSGQLWNKSRAINIALRLVKTPFLLVADIDLLFHQNFIEKATSLAREDALFYFQTGFLTKEESEKNKRFEDLKVNFYSNDEATGITLFPVEVLKDVNGFDEFYHGWGAEDTDVHLRIRNLGIPIHFYNSEVLFKHQWHSKTYRSKKSKNPFHSKLEKINHSYMLFTATSKITKVNLNEEWGKTPDELEYRKLQESVDCRFSLTPKYSDIFSIVTQLKNFQNSTVCIEITDIETYQKSKQQVKKWFGKKYTKFISMQKVNEILLEAIILNYKIVPYRYSFDDNKGIIRLTIRF